MSDSRQTILLDLPPEILELIAWNLDPDDLLNLRFVHSYVAGSTQRPMLQRNYTEVHIMLAMPSSLRRALRLIRHSLLRTYVTTVCVYIDRFQWDVLGIPSKLHPDGGVDRSPTAELACEKRRPLYRRWLRDQHWLERTGNDERELREIFYWLRATSNLEIFVHDLGGAEKVPRDYRKISEEYGDSPAMWSRWDNHRPLQVVLDAIKESSLRPSSFVSTFKEYAIPLSMFGGSETGFGQLLESFRNLTCLDLELQAGPGLPDSLSDDTAISNVLDFLKQVASQLLILELNAFHERDAEYTTSDLDKVFDKMISEVFFSHIEELTLNNITVDYERLLLYLSVHQRTLEEYGLYEILATGTGTDLDGREFNKKVVNDLVVLGLPEPMEYIV